MRWLIATLLLVGCRSNGATTTPVARKDAPAAEVPRFTWPVPDGWKSETIPFPLEFAPDIPHRGVEELRFAPGFFEPHAPGYWSYAFVWAVTGEHPVDMATLEGELTAYFRGLTAAVAKDKKGLPALDLARVQAHLGADGRGSVVTFDAFGDGRQIDLTIAVEVQACGGGKVVRVAASRSGGTPITPSPAEVLDRFVCGGGGGGAAVAEATPPAHTETPIADAYREAATAIIAAAKADTGGWKKLAYLCDHIGHRLSGSASLEKAVRWAVEAMVADGHENVRAEKVMVKKWVRGAESASMIAPVERPLAMIGLGGTIATPRRGLVADVVVARDFDELERMGEAGVKGKIVLFNHPMRRFRSQEEGPGYGDAVAYRNGGPSRAAKLGAVGALVRSVTARSLRSPHTGATGFAKGQKPIPAAAVSVEDADMMTRLVESGQTVRVRLTTSGRHLGDAPSANVVAELRGRETPEEVVVIGGHIDSWDVGQGAHDDGGGCVIAMQALTLLRTLRLTPRRTIRVVLWTNEEQGGAGADEYARAHAAELPDHVAGIEADTGVFAPIGFQIAGDEDGLRRLTDIVTLLAPIGAGKALAGDSGADLEPLQAKGMPGLGLWMDESTYFDYHHTQADTLDKVDPEHLRLDIAAVAVVAYVLADMPERLGKGPPPATP